MKIVLILRDPIEYAVSRYLHLARKGQTSQSDISTLVREDNTLNQELDYLAMTSRFRKFQQTGNLLVIPYKILKVDPVLFYQTVKSHLIGDSKISYRPDLGRINSSRASKWKFMTKLLSGAAVKARERRLHTLVNWAKSFGFHKLIERRWDDRDILHLRELVTESVMTGHQSSVDIYNQVEKSFLNGTTSAGN
jgi:hypothetical protein